MNTLNAHIKKLSFTPHQLRAEFPLPSFVEKSIAQTRTEISQIIKGHNSKLLVIVGPCSIHDPDSALEYATLLKKAADQLSEELFIVMRVYFEKPRTSIGWKGFISDPFLNGSHQLEYGLRKARKLLLDINQLGLPTATEFLDPIIPIFLADLISWSAVGARTSASPLHRELSSALAMPIGFKNSIDGNISVAIEGVKVAGISQAFLSINHEGSPTIFKTDGNSNCHIILRGATHQSNYMPEHISEAIELLKAANIHTRILVDCSHGNSDKDFRQQKKVLMSLIEQLAQGRQEICGVMLESYLVAGKQILQNHTPLTYGQSITDECLSWEETLSLLNQLAWAQKKILSLSTL